MKTIALQRGKVAIVDDEDFEILSRLKWIAHNNGGRDHYTSYAVAKGKIKMHRVVMGAKQGQMIDHINGNGLDNRKENLRPCTTAQNQHNRRVRIDNSSGYKGVGLHAATGLWRARIVFEKRERCLGYFRDPKEAAARYNDEAARLFGSFARLNEIAP